MIPPVIIEFQARGVPDIATAMRSVADVVSRVERGATSATAEGARARSRIVDEEARNREIAARRGEKEFGAALRASVRDADQAARAQTRSAEQAAREKSRAETTAARSSAAEQMRISRQLANEEMRLRTEVARSYGKDVSATTGAKARLAIVQAAKAAPAHEQQAALRNVRDLRVADVGGQGERTAAAKNVAKAAKEGAAREKAFWDSVKQMHDQELSRRREEHLESERTSTKRRQAVASSVVGAGSAAIGTLYRGGVSLAKTAMSLGGGFEVQNVLQDKLSLERNAALLSNTTNMGEGTRISKGAILDTVRKSSVETGTDEDKLMAGLNAFTAKTGKYDQGAQSLSFYSKVAKQSGASVEDVMRTAGTMSVQNKNLSPKDLEQLTLSTVMQARKGSVEFEDMAQAGGKITRSAVAYSGKQSDIQSELLGLSQIGMRTEGNNVAAAATDISAVSRDAIKHRDTVQQLLGHDFLNEQGQIKGGPSQFLADMLESSGGNLAKIQDSGINTAAMKTFQALAPTFNEAKSNALASGMSQTDANKKGKEAVLADIKDVSAGKYDKSDLEQDFATVMRTSAEQFEGSVRLLKQEVADKLVPALIPLIEVIRQATPEVSKLLTSFVGLAGWAASNPLAAAFAGFGTVVAAEVANAGIGKAIEATLATKGGMVIGTGMLAITTAILAIEKMAYDDSAQVNRSVEGTIGGVNARAQVVHANEALANPNLTPEQRAAAESSRDEGLKKQRAAKEMLEKSVKDREADRGGNKYFRGIALAGSVVADTTTGHLLNRTGDTLAAQKDREATDDKAIVDIKAEIQQLTTALNLNTIATKANSGAAAAPAPGAPGGGQQGPIVGRIPPKL